MKKILLGSIFAGILMSNIAAAAQHVRVPSLKPMFDAQKWISRDLSDVVTIESFDTSRRFSVQIYVDSYDERAGNALVKNCSPEKPIVEVKQNSSIVCSLDAGTPISISSASNEKYAFGLYQIN